MKPIMISTALLALPLSLQAAETRQDLRFVAGAALGYTTLEFPAKLDHDLTFITTNLTAAATWRRWNLSLNAAFDVDEADISEEEDVGSAGREDIDLTLGYQLHRNWSLFAGYKRGETTMDFVSREPDEDDGEFLRTSESYEQEGPFIGAGFSWQFERAGRLSISAAYADLRATNRFAANTDEEEGDDEPPEFDDLTGTVKGDTTGFSYTLAWTMPLSSRLLFQTRFKVNDYQQDIRFEGETFDNIDETLSSLHVGLAYVF